MKKEMRKNPILELAAGLATPAAVLLMPIRMFSYVEWNSFMATHTSELISMFGIPLALGICVAIGSILDFYFRHGLAFFGTCVFCILTAIYSAFWSFSSLFGAVR